MTSVITGDIINSRNVSNQVWLQTLKTIFNEVNPGEFTEEIVFNWRLKMR